MNPQSSAQLSEMEEAIRLGPEVIMR
jgi:hypothetical protein